MGDARDRNAGIWIDHGDRLYVAAYSSVASLVVRFSGYYRKMDGSIIEYAVDVEPTSDRAVTAKDFFFGAGFLLSCMATLATGNANRGQCYVRAHIQRGTGAAAVKLHNVIGGYVTDEYAPSCPYGKIEGSLDGPGIVKAVIGTNPAVLTDIVEAVPAGARWRVLSVYFTLVTDANVANRRVVLLFDNGTVFVAQAISGTAQTAGATVLYSAAHYGSAPATELVYGFINIPEMVLLPAGSTIQTSTTNMQAGDNFSAPTLWVEEWIEG